ncbi:OsmC family protein [Aestuariicella hydrocarbonica]|uniref:OsmC family protein n=1 Tax=Pseudomaricurvus hydrocarbonicus TaxID=1470433 RepID=A0A9E5MQC8_9GAMM|nr:OsmC family protein [Aestuariicella hydrocarbonica]NHO68367.1 OsmC family protein [Aestuariicella hydrocarbonica]
MQQLPHQYKVKVEGQPEGSLATSAKALPVIQVAPPEEFGGPGDQWSPEELLMASLADCLVLSFKSIARASRLEWSAIECESDGKLEKVGSKVQFTDVLSTVRLTIPASASQEKAEKLLHKAEETCFISNSLACETRLACEIVVAGD